MKERDLTREQQEQFNQLKKVQYGDEQTYELCLNYYLKYKECADIHLHDKVSLAFKCAYFAAEKSQHTVNVLGEKVKGVSLSLSQLIRDHRIDELMIMLRDFAKRNLIEDADARQDLNDLVSEISSLIIYHKKFEKVIARLELQDKSNDTTYLKTFCSLMWLVIAYVKKVRLVSQGSMIECTCIMAHSMASFAFYASDFVTSKYLLRLQPTLYDKAPQDAKLIIVDKVRELFSIKETDTYLGESQAFQSILYGLLKEGIFKSSADKDDCFGPELIQQSYRRLDAVYERILGPEELDERIFFKDRAVNLTPSKFTPFARHGYATKTTKQKVGLQTFASHRILNYQMLEKQEVHAKPVCEMKLPKTILQSPSMMKVPLICSTPITTGMEMFNYISEKSRKAKDISTNKSQFHDASILHLIQEAYELAKKDNKKNRQSRILMIFSLYKIAAEDYLTQRPNEKDNFMVAKGLAALSIEMVLFVENSQFNFEDIEEAMEVDTIELWKACDYFLKFDKMMPSPLKLHLLDLEVAIISWKMWKDHEVISLLSAYIKEERGSPEYVERLFKRTLHQTAFQVKELCAGLELNEHITEQIYQATKFVISQKLQIMGGRHLDQMIMCAVYAICKHVNIKTKFGQIIEKYQEKNSHIKAQFQSIIYQIAVANSEATTNLIQLYNEQFVMPMREYVEFAEKRDPHNAFQYSKKTVNPVMSNLLQSPLREIIPSEVNKGLRKRITMKNNNVSQTHLLYAYNESPMLKHVGVPVKAPVHCKKLINYQEEEERFKKEANLVDNYKNSPKALPTQFNNKKFANVNWKTAKNQDTTVKSQGIRHENIRNQSNKHQVMRNEGVRNEGVKNDFRNQINRHQMMRNEGVRNEGVKNDFRNQMNRNEVMRNEGLKHENISMRNDMMLMRNEGRKNENGRKAQIMGIPLKHDFMRNDEMWGDGMHNRNEGISMRTQGLSTKNERSERGEAATTARNEAMGRNDGSGIAQTRAEGVPTPARMKTPNYGQPTLFNGYDGAHFATTGRTTAKPISSFVVNLNKPKQYEKRH